MKSTGYFLPKPTTTFHKALTILLYIVLKGHKIYTFPTSIRNPMSQPFSFVFSFPKLSSKRCFSSVQNLTTRDSYPMVSTNISSYKAIDHDNFVHTNNVSLQSAKSETEETSFRPRNRFIIAHHVMGTILKKKRRKLRHISRTSGTVRLFIVEFR
jgi:hypothetical protein